MNNGYVIDVERPEDYYQVENLTREAFWNVYLPGCVERYILRKFRNRPEFIPELSLCMRQNGRIIAHVMCLHTEIRLDDGGVFPVMTF